jgi:hypothetical protein
MHSPSPYRRNYARGLLFALLIFILHILTEAVIMPMLTGRASDTLNFTLSHMGLALRLLFTVSVVLLAVRFFWKEHE